ncbi:conserved unknown protein [Ectocarpus siliculosus]|uniref:Uncharacterized protein n=1 Tax=Ectocarpus siliculosus TaxID=2880 RepID=D8LLH8_ECTSI|nr:conserved unknown protein [Ectocarpus siliculosus]|eukprot:CBN76158.1 conserved unknown protein [Ectocarpus siliculosus]
MAILGVHNGRSRGGGRSRRGGRGSGARGPPKSGVRQAAAFASPVIGGGTSVRKRHPRADLTSTELPLGQVLRTVGGLVGGEGLKVSAVGKHITSLEGVPSGVSSRATQLFLSNNSLRWLRGVEAFSGVVCLSISHNLVRRTEDLHPLSLLAHLEMLSLEGNPVCGAANYRAHVVSLASACLKTLDGREMLAVLQADSWPVFDQSELDVLERQILEEAAEVLVDFSFDQLHLPNLGRRVSQSILSPASLTFRLCACDIFPWKRHGDQADVVNSRRAAGQRTNELLESAVATLNSPGTRMWVQVLGEVQRRTEGKVSDVVLRCESVRRREAERFRHVSGQTNTFLQDLAAAVGCSDNQWAVPPCKARAVQRTTGASAGGGAPRNTRNTTPSMPLGGSRPSSSISLPQPADKPRVRMLSSPERGRTVRTTLSRSCPVGIAGTVPVADTAQSPEAMAEESIVLDAPNRATENGGRGMAGAGKRDPPSPGHVARGIEGEFATGDKTEALRSRSASPVLLGAQSEAGAVGQGTTVAAVERVPEVAAVGRGQSLKSITTMASAAKVLLARREDGERLGGPLSLSPTQAAALQDPSKQSAVAGRRNPPTAEVDDLVDSNSNLSIGRGGDDKAETQLSRWRASNRFEGRPDSAPRILNGSNTRRRLIVGQNSTGESPERNERRSESRRVSPGGESVEQPPQPDAIASPGVYTLATAAITLVDGRPATGQQQLYTPQQGGVRWGVGTFGSGTVGTTAEQGEDGGAEGEVRAGGHHGSTSEATTRLLREALRVKRVLAEMDKADATGSAIDNGLGDEDPEKFLATLGLVELKPLSARLVEALERAPRPLLGDPSVAVPEPRTTRGLRDQVAALGKEVAQRTEACAEARKLHAALRRQVEVTRRARARNMDRVDVTCRTLIAKAGGEVQVLHESRRVAHEAERYHATLARIQEQVEATTGETRKIVSTSEAIAWELRAEMEGRGGELSCRKRDAEEGLADWERAAQNDPDLRARRRAYDCEVLALRHRMGCGGANNISLASAFHLLRARTAQQRRAREWFARSTARRNALLVRSAFTALARGSRCRAATAAVAAARCRRGLAAWKRAATLARKIRTLCWLRERAAAVKALQGWRQRCVKAVYLAGGSAGGEDGRWAAGREEREDLEWRLELFRERRAKRVVLQAWRAAAQTSAVVTVMQGEAKCGWGREVGRRGCAAIQDEVAACSGWGARLRTAEALGRRHRFETQIGSAFRWWRRHRQCKVLARTAGQRRAIRRWRHRVNDIRSSHEATAEARGSYVLSLGRRVLAAWSSAAATRVRRRTGAASLASALAFSTKRRSFRQWAFQAAAAAREADNTVVALGHYGDRCLRDHLRAWSAFARERCALRRCVGLLLRGRRVCLTAAGLRLWRRQTAKARDANLRECRIMAWTAAAARRRRFAALSVCFSAWTSTRRRVAAIHSLTRRAAARRRRLALAVGFRAFSLSGRRAATATAAATAERSHISRGEDTTRYNNGYRPRGDMGVVVEEATAPVQTAIAAKVALEGKREGEEGGDGEVAAAVVEEPFRSRGRGKMGPTKLTEKESLLIIKLQAETRELRQREAVAAKQEERLRLEAARKAAATAESLESALAERNRLKAQAEQHEVLFAQLDSEAQQAAAQAAALSDRLAGAEQDLGFEATRNTQELRERNEGNARLRAAATAAEERIAIAESTLRRKGLEIEELRSKCAKAGLDIGGRGKGGRQGRGGRASDTAGLEFRIFAASADARSALERCTVAADERRTAAGSVLAEALRVAGSEADTIKSNEAEFDCTSHEGGVAAARRIAAESVADERREVADLALREAEAKLRNSADLSLRASLDHRPLANPRSLFEEGATTTPSSKVNSPVPGTGDPAPDRPENRKGNPNLNGNFREEAATEQEHPMEPQGASQPARNKDVCRAGGTKATTRAAATPRALGKQAGVLIRMYETNKA